MMLESGLQVALFAICCFVGITAIPGGIALAVGPEKRRFPLELLAYSPFASYVEPGMVLTFAVGGTAAFAAVITYHNTFVGGFASIMAGVTLMGWILGEIYILRQPFSRQTLWELFYFGLGLAMLLLGVWFYMGGRTA